MTNTHPASIREAVRERYASAAREASRGDYDAARRIDAGAGPCGVGCGPTVAEEDVFGVALYGEEARDVPRAAVEASLGCGIPTAVADLREGETVLDLGSGAGADVLISARRVGARGRAIGLDMTDETLELARANARDAGLDNLEFIKGYIEDIPLADASVDVVISNCVINLAADKDKVLGEAARVLRAGGRLAVSDVIADPDMDEARRRDMEQWTGCIAGALTRDEYERALSAAGLVDIEIAETHRVHEHASSAIVHARKPCGTTPERSPQSTRSSTQESPAKAQGFLLYISPSGTANRPDGNHFGNVSRRNCESGLPDAAIKQQRAPRWGQLWRHEWRDRDRPFRR